jgi:hypothetical protein
MKPRLVQDLRMLASHGMLVRRERTRPSGRIARRVESAAREIGAFADSLEQPQPLDRPLRRLAVAVTLVADAIDLVEPYAWRALAAAITPIGRAALRFSSWCARRRAEHLGLA